MDIFQKDRDFIPKLNTNDKYGPIMGENSDPNSQVLTHWPPLGRRNDLKNDFTKKVFIHFQRSVNFEMSFWGLQISQKTNEIYLRISALASTKKSNQKSTVRESK